MRAPLLFLLLLIATVTNHEMIKANDVEDDYKEDEVEPNLSTPTMKTRRPNYNQNSGAQTKGRVGNKPPAIQKEELENIRSEGEEKMKAHLRRKGVPLGKIRDGKDGKILLPNPDRKKKIQLRKRIQARARGYESVKREGGLAAVFFPGVSPEEFEEDEEIPMWVDLVESQKAQVPYRYYDLPVCEGPSAQKTAKYRKNLGAKLAGHDSQPSPYEIFAKRDMSCTVLCTVNLKPGQMRKLNRMMDRQYRINVSIDSLPVLLDNSEFKTAIRGYPVGFKAPPDFKGPIVKGARPSYFLYNHVKFVISYRESPGEFDGIRIVGFEAKPISINHNVAKDHVNSCNAFDPVVNKAQTLLPIRPNLGPTDIVYSYEVEWVERDDIYWSNRWDAYMVSSPDDKVHTVAILNSFITLLVLTLCTTAVFLRTLKKDIARYNSFELDDGEKDTGWKLVHGDVFRPPRNFPKILNVVVGTGAQIFTTIVLVILASVCGFISTMDKGQTLTAVIMVYLLSGWVAGFISARLSKLIDDSEWKRNIILTASAFPGMLASIFMVLNVFLTFDKAATAVSFFTIVLMFLLWLCISAPLVFLGAWVGYRFEKISVPVKTNKVASAVPENNLTWYVKPPYSMLISGFVAFSACYVEIFIILDALWLHHIYYIMAFLIIVVFILAATCAQLSMVGTYLQLCDQDHRWWWRSFWNSASVGCYLMVYSLWYASSILRLVGILPVLTYLMYMSILSTALGMFCGSVGFLSSLYFVRKIYGAVKFD
eukprot:CAMPEP_0195533622 /NCGR_PEP_ID=MMETSP0794_2-20130614/40833_1 /TAXON_ID=515487 /ORGANISM="Stephanopyxis turris, Strain CCMP 815" /LENGTH=763 /DNA_ID=CAMNT_0040666213 /DNA_START=380 /DNA_END=2671 /DNA_ORIENTATION=-